MDKFRKVRSKLIGVAKFPNPGSAVNNNGNRSADDDFYAPQFEDASCQTECTFPSWVHVWDNPQLIEEQEILSNLLAFDTQFQKEQREAQRKKLIQFQKEHQQQQTSSSSSSSMNNNNNNNNMNISTNSASPSSPTLIKTSPTLAVVASSHAEREFMRRLHSQEYKTLQKLRELIRTHMTDLGTTVYDLCAYKDIALTMKERYAVGPISDLVLMSSKLFRRCSDLSRSLATFFNIAFADDFCDRDFDFTDQRMTKLALRRTEQELESVTKERDELRKRCRDAESRLLEYAKSQTVLQRQRDDAEARYSGMSQDMALLFQKSVDDVMKIEQENLKSTDMVLDAHNLVAPARSIAQQSVDNTIDKLSNVAQSLKALHDDVAQVDYGGAMRTAVRNMEGLVSSCLSKLAHVRDGIRTSADQMRHEIHQRRKAVELSVLHVLAAEKMRTKLRHGREVLNAVREKAILCSDLVRTSRIAAVERRKGIEDKLLEEYYQEHPEHLPNNSDEYNNNTNENSVLSFGGGGKNSPAQQQQRPDSSKNKPTPPPPQPSQLSGILLLQQQQQQKRNPTPPPDLTRENSEAMQHFRQSNSSSRSLQQQQYQIMQSTSSNKKQMIAMALKQFQLQQGSTGNSITTNHHPSSSSAVVNATNINHNNNISTTTTTTSSAPPPPPILCLPPLPPPVFIIPPEPFDFADEFSLHITNLITTISNTSSMLSHEDELTDIVDSLTCSIPQAAVANNKNSLSVLQQQQQMGQVNGGGSAVIPLGRELMDSAIEAMMTNNQNNNNNGGDGSSASSNNPASAAFKQFAEMAQFMREMFEERIRELEEVKQASTSSLTTTTTTSTGGASSATADANNSNIAVGGKTDAEMLEEQAVTVLEGWRKRRRGESNLGKIQIADALRDLDTARRVRKQKYQEQLKKEGVSKRFEFGGIRHHHHHDDDDDEDDVAETPSLVIDVSQVTM